MVILVTTNFPSLILLSNSFADSTPGGAHVEPIKQAIEFGCHVFCDKPLTESGETAQEIYDLSVKCKVKTAFAASFRYMPEIMHAKQLVASGAIGMPTEVECVSHFNLDRHIPFGWSHNAAACGRRLNNNFTHLLSIVTSVIGEKILSVSGEIRDDMGCTPVVEGVHNFMERRNFIPDDINDPSFEWKKSDVEWSYTVLAQIEAERETKQPVSVLFTLKGIMVQGLFTYSNKASQVLRLIKPLKKVVVIKRSSM